MKKNYYRVKNHPNFDDRAHRCYRTHKGEYVIGNNTQTFAYGDLINTPGVRLEEVSDFTAAKENCERTIKTLDGCSDGFCLITGPAKGMHTNGGCRCVKDRDTKLLLQSMWRLWGTIK